MDSQIRSLVAKRNLYLHRKNRIVHGFGGFSAYNDGSIFLSPSSSVLVECVDMLQASDASIDECIKALHVVNGTTFRKFVIHNTTPQALCMASQVKDIIFTTPERKPGFFGMLYINDGISIKIPKLKVIANQRGARIGIGSLLNTESRLKNAAKGAVLIRGRGLYTFGDDSDDVLALSEHLHVCIATTTLQQTMPNALFGGGSTKDLY